MSEPDICLTIPETCRRLKVSRSSVYRMAEQALAHTIENKTEAAYRRGDALEKRRVMMAAWERFLMSRSADVVALRG